jgi:hypothetical protein
MRLTRERTVRRPIWALLGSALLLAVAVPASIQVHTARDAKATAHMIFVAERVAAPAAMNPLVLNHDCHGDALMSCSWTPDHDVDSLARRARSDLGKTAAMPTRLQCVDLPGVSNWPLRSCLVAIGGTSHAVTLSLDPYVKVVDGQAELLGTRYTVEAD